MKRRKHSGAEKAFGSPLTQRCELKLARSSTTDNHCVSPLAQRCELKRRTPQGRDCTSSHLSRRGGNGNTSNDLISAKGLSVTSHAEVGMETKINFSGTTGWQGSPLTQRWELKHTHAVEGLTFKGHLSCRGGNRN